MLKKLLVILTLCLCAQGSRTPFGEYKSPPDPSPSPLIALPCVRRPDAYNCQVEADIELFKALVAMRDCKLEAPLKKWVKKVAGAEIENPLCHLEEEDGTDLSK